MEGLSCDGQRWAGQSRMEVFGRAGAKNLQVASTALAEQQQKPVCVFHWHLRPTQPEQEEE